MPNIAQAYDILQASFHAHKPVAIIVLYSGGYDSMVTAHLTHEWVQRFPPRLFVYRVISVDTHISADGWREFVSRTGAQFGEHEIWDNPEPEWYFKDSMNFGFPYTRQAHVIQYRHNKERAIMSALKEYKTTRNSRVMFVTGVRRAESRARANAPEWDRRGSAVFCNPLINWTSEALAQHRYVHDLPINPFYDTVRGSGDCQCNWGGFITLPTLLKHSPRLGERIAALDAACRARHGWGWGERPSFGVLAERNGQLPLFADVEGNKSIVQKLHGAGSTPNLCADCERVVTNQERDFVIMQRMDWSTE